MSKQDPASGLKKFFDSAAEAHFGMSKAAEVDILPGMNAGDSD